MYYPYFRGKLHELLALREAMAKLHASGKVCPIVEPMKRKTGQLNAFLKDAAGKIPHAVVMNPSSGELAGKGNAILTAIQPFLSIAGNDLIPAYLVDDRATFAKVDAFLNQFQGRKTLLVVDRPAQAVLGLAAHLQSNAARPIIALIQRKRPVLSQALINSFKSFDRVLLEDGFQRQITNAQYPPSDAFGNLQATYKRLGFQGFGDFSIVGNIKRDGGGAAVAVALHLTEEVQNAIITNHFVSLRRTGRADVAGKFREALSLLIAHINSHPTNFAYSSACRDYEQLHRTQHYPGLGIPKRYSMRHHLELMVTLI